MVNHHMSDREYTKLRKVLEMLPDDLNNISVIAFEKSSERAGKIAKIVQDLPDIETRINRLRAFVDDADQTEQVVDGLRRLLTECEARRHAIDEFIEEKVPRQWNWKRIIWALVSGMGGLGASWYLQTRTPILNHAASGATGSILMDAMGVRGRGRQTIGAAGFSLLGRWCGGAAGDNGAMPIVEVGLAAVSYGEVIFCTGENVADAFTAWKREREQEMQRENSEISEEAASSA